MTGSEDNAHMYLLNIQSYQLMLSNSLECNVQLKLAILLS